MLANSSLTGNSFHAPLPPPPAHPRLSRARPPGVRPRDGRRDGALRVRRGGRGDVGGILRRWVVNEHTPTPWYFQTEIEVDGVSGARRKRHHIYCKTGTFGHPAECLDRDDAEFIVLACNAYDNLIAEVAHWKGRYEDERRDHEATIEHCERHHDEWGF